MTRPLVTIEAASGDRGGPLCRVVPKIVEINIVVLDAPLVSMDRQLLPADLAETPATFASRAGLMS